MFAFRQAPTAPVRLARSAREEASEQPIVLFALPLFLETHDERKCQVKGVSDASLTDHVFNALNSNAEQTQKKY